MPDDILSIYAQSQPDKPAVIDDKPDGTVVVWTYAELEAQANRLANLLLSLGAGPGKKVLWCGPNSPEVVAVMSASRKIGAVAVPLNYRLTPEEALYVINHSDAEVAYVDHEQAPMFAALRNQLEKIETLHHHIELYRDNLLPTARQTVASYQADYETDKATLLSLLSSQRNLRDLETMYYQDLSDYRVALAELESLVGLNPNISGTAKSNAMGKMR